jgi:hypothetical protein
MVEEVLECVSLRALVKEQTAISSVFRHLKANLPSKV